MGSRIFLSIAASWVLVVCGSVVLNWKSLEDSVLELARVEARSHFEKDTLYRRWAAKEGGLYVPPSEFTPPNPYLSGIPDRDVVTTGGKRLTLVNPAYMTRQVHELAADQFRVRGHITSLNPLRPENRADSWEQEALRRFEVGDKEVVVRTEIEGKPFLRFMGPLLTEEACLRCHASQGYKLGQVRGGISVAVSLEPYIVLAEQQKRPLLVGHGIVGGLGLLGLWVGARRQRRNEVERALQAERAQALLQLPLAAEKMDEAAFMQFGQELAEKLTGSEIAFIHFVNDDEETIELVTWSRRTLESYCTATFDKHYPVSQAGIWAEALRRRETVVFNDYASAPGRRGLPDGHAELKRLISVPVMENDRVVMLAGVGNKREAYNEFDAETVQLIASGIWRIVQRRRSVEQLRKLSLAVEQSPESIVITDLEAKIEYVNDAFVQSSGYSREELIGQNPRILRSGNTPSETHAAMWRALEAGQAWKGEFQNRKKDGSEYVEFAIVAPLRQANGELTHYVAVKEDITEKKRNAVELDHHRNHLEMLVKARTTELEFAKVQADAANMAKSNFLANMSHEIRTPMNGVLGMAALLRRAGVTQTQGEYLAKIEASGRHLLTVINDILDLSKIEAGKLQLESRDFSLAKLTHDVVAVIAARVKEKDLGFVVDLAGAPDALRGDGAHLAQALVNYLSNAVKFTERGEIALRCRLVEEAEESYLLRFEVADTGIGIRLQDQARVFRAFEQADNTTTRRFGGTGLGLKITKRLAEMMGGEVGVESELAKGSTFWLTVRVGKGAADGAAMANAPGETAESRLKSGYGGSRVLIVEDDELSREIVATLLRDVGLKTDWAQDGTVALEMAALNDYDLIIMDMQMPVMGGIEATQLIRKLRTRSETPIVALTANAFDEDQEQCLAAGMNDFIGKPFGPDALFEIVLKWLAGKPRN